MLVVLLLISQATCEWVEISQNHYSKEPPKTGTQQISNIEHDDFSKDFWNIRNESVVEKQWNKAVIDRVTNVGNIRRVQVPSVKTPSIKTSPGEENIEKHNDQKFEISMGNMGPNRQQSKYKPFHKVEVSISRNEETNTRYPTTAKPVKSVQTMSRNADNSHKSSPQNPTHRRKIIIDEEIYNQNKNSVDHNIHRIQGTEMRNEDAIHKDNDRFNEGKDILGNFKKIANLGQNKIIAENIPNSGLTTPITKTIDIILNKDTIKEYQDFGKSTTYREDYFKEVTLRNDKFSNTSLATKPKFHITKLDQMQSEYPSRYITDLNLHTSKPKTSWRHDLDSNFSENPTHKKIFNTFQENKNAILHSSEEISNATKGDSVSGMWKMMKLVTDTIYKNTRRSVKSKIKYLEDLKTTIITSIEDHIDTVWPNDVEHRHVKRSARSAQARGHLEFPSSESTLMTISFLTFAVFLIKLVLQVIHTYKNKTMMVAPAVVAAVGRTAAAIRAERVRY